MSYPLAGKTALITGANHGIGAATAKSLAIQGAKVFISFYLPDCPYSKTELEDARRERVGGRLLSEANQQQSPDVVLHDIASRGGHAAAKKFDLGEADNIPRLFNSCEREFGAVDILIINHTHCKLETFDPGLVSDGEFEVRLTTVEGIDRHFAVNARASALMMREYLQRHIDRKSDWGRIVSMTTAFALEWNISYAASKRAVVSYTQTAAAEMGKYGITANVVCPGPTQTGYLTPDQEEALAARTPLKRIGHSEDIADVIGFLASEQGRWITGQVIYATGGFMTYPQ